MIETDRWSVPPLFRLIVERGNVSKEEQYRTFNMGIGMIIALSPKAALDARSVLPELLTVGYVRALL